MISLRGFLDAQGLLASVCPILQFIKSFKYLLFFSNGEMYALLIEWLNKTPVGSPSRNHKREVIISSILGNKV